MSDGFPETEQISDQFEALLIRYHQMQVQPDIFVLKVRGLMHRASQLFLTEDVNSAVSPATKAEAEPSPVPMELVEKDRPRRTPDIETSRQRIALYDRLGRELATIHHEVKKHTTVEKLKTKLPGFKLWGMLSPMQQHELLDGEFKPRAYAGNLTIESYGLTSLSTFKKDRKKLRDWQKRHSSN